MESAVFSARLIYVEFEVSVDKQDRLVIPAPLRKILDLTGGGKVVLSLEGDRVVLKIVNRDLEGRVKVWKNFAMSVKAEAMSEEEVGESWKWMSWDYARRKLGLC